MSRLDDLRAEHPDLGFGLYALEPGAPVTLEVIDATGTIYTFRAATEADVLDLAFPAAALPQPSLADAFG